jgi:acylphosphatase
MAVSKQAKLFVVRGRVQGVGFRYFVQKHAEMLGLKGYARNLDDGSVEVYAIGTSAELSELNGLLWKGPSFSDVRLVEEKEAVVEKRSGFLIEPM